VHKVASEADVNFGTQFQDTDHVMDIGEMALDCWRKYMIEPIKEKLIKLVLDGIDRDRRGDTVNQSVLHGVINSLVDVADKRQKSLVLYETLFEKAFIEQTGEYYKKEASKLLSENNCSAYMKKVDH
jgi:cullin 2